MQLGLLTLSVILQFTAAILAWRLVIITSRQLAWSVFAAAITLIAICWSMELVSAWKSGDVSALTPAIFTLPISFLILIGVARFGPMLQRLEDSHTLLQSLNISLELEIAERERAEADLKRTEARWRGAVEGLQEAFALYDHDNKLVYWNDDWARLHPQAVHVIREGMPYEELVETQIRSGSIPSAIGREDEFIKERIALHEKPQGEMLREYADGTWFIIKESRTDDGGYVATNTDITELNKTEARLVESERRMSHLVEALQDGFALFDPEDRLVMWNNSWYERHRGISNAIKVGTTFEELSRAMMASQQIPEAIGREDAYVAERVNAHKNPGPPMQRKMNDGRWYIITEIHTEDGGILSLQSDITDIKSAEENAERLRLEAELANQAKSSLLVNMSHELRTPLNAIIGFSQILEQELFGPLGNDRYRDYASDVNNAGQHLLSLINDLLDISKIELGEAELAEAEVNLQDGLGSCVRMLEQRAIKTGVSVTLDIAPQSLALRVDERRLKQIVLNIAGNAVKFSQEKNVVAIRATLLESGACQISVEDHGAGISEDDLLRVTEPFYQTNGTYARQTDGIGLGLYIAKSLCSLHDAELTFESTLGKGTTVSVTFPPERTIPAESDQHAAE